MSLSKEWRARLNNWVEELKRNLYRPVSDLEFEGFVTTDQLDTAQACGGSFEAYPVGRKWGQRWEYGWFRTTVTVPQELEGRRVAVCPELTSREALVWSNGQMIESVRGTWPWLTLTKSATAGEQFDLLIEAYAWHYQERCKVGPVSDWRDYGPAGDGPQQCIGKSTLGFWDDEAMALYMDVRVLLGIRDAQEPQSLRVAQIDEALRKFTLAVDFQQDIEGRRSDYAEAREILRPMLAAKNGTVAPEFFAFGHAHLDVAWLWPLAETRRKAARTLANQLAIIDEYPDYRFMHSQPQVFEMVRQDYPDLYERVKKAVASGNIIADGAAWIEPDTNMSGGEALIRQLITGKRFIRDEFGLDSRHLWLPDVFGYSGALPQILRGCGVETFSTQKIFWNYQSEDVFPYHNFIWEGIDGSEIIVHLHHDYNSTADPGMLVDRWKTRVQSDGMSTRLFPFGWGDGGGGPARFHLESLARLEDCQGCPKVRMSTPQEFFDDLVERGEHDRNRWVGELYFSSHRGVLTSQAKTKQGNRRSEIALREAEMWLTAASLKADGEYPVDTLDELWKLVLLNQFHDILPGSSIRRVYEEAEADYARVIGEATDMARTAASALGETCDGSLAVFNSLNWQRSELIALPQGAVAATDSAGEALATQQIGDTSYVEVTVPACGWTSVKAEAGVAGVAGVAGAAGASDEVVGDECGVINKNVRAEGGLLENELVSIYFNSHGEISSMVDRLTGRELLVGGGNILRLYRDEPGNYDAWDIDSMYDQCPVDISGGQAEMKVISSGPLAGVLELTRSFSGSRLTQRITLRRDSRRIDFDTRVDWHEKHRLLKVCFGPGIRCENAIHEVQFGYIQRPTHVNRIPDQDRFEVCNHRYTAMVDGGRGFAVLNDSKYGVSTRNGEIGLSLLRAPLGPDEQADQGVQEFSYAAMAFDGAFADSDVPRQGYELNCRPLVIENVSGSGSLLEISGDGVILETVKSAEDGSGDLVLRLYESCNRSTSALVSFNMPVDRVERTDMLEGDGVELPMESSTTLVELNPFEVVTLRVK